MDDDYQPERGLAFALRYSIIAILIIGAILFYVTRARALDLYLPPEKYDHPYSGPVVEQIVPISQVPDYCVGAKFYNVQSAYGCSMILLLGVCKIVIAQMSDSDMNEVRRHEYGHCNEAIATLTSNEKHQGWRVNPNYSVKWVPLPMKPIRQSN